MLCIVFFFKDRKLFSFVESVGNYTCAFCALIYVRETPRFGMNGINLNIYTINKFSGTPRKVTVPGGTGELENSNELSALT